MSETKNTKTNQPANTNAAAQGKFIREFKASSLDHAQRACREAASAGGVYTYGPERPHMGLSAKYVVRVYRETTKNQVTKTNQTAENFGETLDRWHLLSRSEKNTALRSMTDGQRQVIRFNEKLSESEWNEQQEELQGIGY